MISKCIDIYPVFDLVGENEISDKNSSANDRGNINGKKVEKRAFSNSRKIDEKRAFSNSRKIDEKRRKIVEKVNVE
ncbi:hypothetical protein MHBO_003716, partial [Bonamia ostreae]